MTLAYSPDQGSALEQVVDWHRRLKVNIIHCNGGGGRGLYTGACPKTPHTHADGDAPVFALGGWAGTGKTTLVKALAAALGVRVVYGAPTHKAAAVLRRKLTGHQACEVRTYHSLVYHMHAIYHCAVTGRIVRRVVDNCTCGQSDACECPARFDPCQTRITHQCRVQEELTPERREYLAGHREIVIIDEASMLSPEQVADIRSFGLPVILVGDNGQLPPVKAEMNPWIRNPDVELTQIHRQGADSGILQAAHDVRRHGYMRRNTYGTGDAVRMPFSHEAIEGVLERFTPGPNRLVVTATNEIRSHFNEYWHGEGPVREGDRVVALGGQTYEALRAVAEGTGYRATSDFLLVHNGMTGTVLDVTDNGGPMLDMIVQLDDHPLATPIHPVCLLIAGAARAQFGAQQDLWKNSPERPKGSRLWDYAYALTAHKAQGSEFDQVIVIDSGTQSYAQWLYTSITRAKEAVLVLNYRS